LKKYIRKIFENLNHKLNYIGNAELILTVPQHTSHGDLSTNIAMLLSKKLRKPPREIASEIIENLEYDNNKIKSINIAGPGFINFFFQPSFVAQIIKNILDERENFGRSNEFEGKKAQVEFVSANPTGPLTVGHGRNAVLGDTIANLLEWVGYNVEREYYFNNAGRQMKMLGESVKTRYLQLFDPTVEFSEEYYQGEYIIDIAEELKRKFADKLIHEKSIDVFKQNAEEIIFENIKTTLENLDITFDNFFNEKSLYENGNIDKVLKLFEEKKLTYKKENALWLKLTELGQEQDKVIIKSSGEPTYRLPDIAYHVTKFERGYDLMIDIFGSDHAATYPDVLAGIKALGYNPEKVKVIIYQFVTILKNGEVVKMSTRKANFITLDELIEEVGKDVVRYFFIMRNHSSHMNFDLDLAKKQSDENPVFYLQYAHARISSIIRMTREEKLNPSIENLALLNTFYEQNLLKQLHFFPEELYQAAKNFEPHKIANYLETLAALFHKFYTECRIIGSEKKLAEARIALIIATQIVLRNGLSLLGVSAPEKM